MNNAPKVNENRALSNRKNSRVFIDYLSFTVNENLVQGYGHTRIRNFARLLWQAFPDFELMETEKGLYGYTHQTEIFLCGSKVGTIAAGGNNGSIYVQLAGGATVWIDPATWADWLDAIKARITRIDIAHDDMKGSVSVDQVRQAYIDGEFKNRGQNPSCSLAGPWDDPDQWGKGRTYYIGKRENGRMLRAYEKGKQLGDPTSPWVRFEVEFRRQRDRELVTDMLRKPLQYFIGAYQYLSWVEHAEPAKLDRVKVAAEITYESLVGFAKASYGKLINVMNSVCETPDQIIEALRVDGIPKRLQFGAIPNG